MSNKNRYVFIAMQGRSVPGNDENYLNVSSVDSLEGEPSIVIVTTGSAAIRIKKPGRYLMITRLSISSANPNVEVVAYKWTGSAYDEYRTIASIQTTGMIPLTTIVSIDEEEGRIAVMIKNNNNTAVSIGSGTAIILVPLF